MIKRKFSDLLKVKKQKLSEVEQQLQDVQNRCKRLQGEIQQVDLEISQLDFPTSGTISVLHMAQETFRIKRQEKKTLHERLIQREKQLEGLSRLYKEVSMEYEKIVYLDDEEKKEILKEQQEQESKALDEIANILFMNKRKKVEV